MNSHTAPVCPLSGLKLVCPFVIQQRINNSKGWLSITQHCLTFFLSFLWRESHVLKVLWHPHLNNPDVICWCFSHSGLVDPLLSLSLSLSLSVSLSLSLPLLCDVRTSRDVTTFIHSASVGGLQGPCAGADRWISTPKGSGKRWEREERHFPSFNILYISQICSTASHAMARGWQRTAVRMMAVLHTERTQLLLHYNHTTQFEVNGKNIGTWS